MTSKWTTGCPMVGLLPAPAGPALCDFSSLLPYDTAAHTNSPLPVDASATRGVAQRAAIAISDRAPTKPRTFRTGDDVAIRAAYGLLRARHMTVLMCGRVRRRRVVW